MDERNERAGKRNETLASEIYGDLKAELKFRNRLIYILIEIIVGLAAALLCLGLYHNWRWSQFERVSVDSQTGPATYVQGENTGGVNIGASSSTPAEGRPVEGDAD